MMKATIELPDDTLAVTIVSVCGSLAGITLNTKSMSRYDLEHQADEPVQVQGIRGVGSYDN